MDLRGLKPVASLQQNVGGSSETLTFTSAGRYLLVNCRQDVTSGTSTERTLRVGIGAVDATETNEDPQTWLVKVGVYSGGVLLDLWARRTVLYVCSNLTENYQFTLLEDA